jgi:hypothetical protein
VSYGPNGSCSYFAVRLNFVQRTKKHNFSCKRAFLTSLIFARWMSRQLQKFLSLNVQEVLIDVFCRSTKCRKTKCRKSTGTVDFIRPRPRRPLQGSVPTAVVCDSKEDLGVRVGKNSDAYILKPTILIFDILSFDISDFDEKTQSSRSNVLQIKWGYMSTKCMYVHCSARLF